MVGSQASAHTVSTKCLSVKWFSTKSHGAIEAVVTHLQIHHEAIQLPGLEKGEHGLESDISKLFFFVIDGKA